MLRILSTILLCLLMSAPASAVPKAVQLACHSDVLKFCRAVINDAAKRHDCMKEHYYDLSDGCKSAIDASH